MKYGRLVNGSIRYAPNTVQWEDEHGEMHTVNAPKSEKLLQLGYFPVTYTDPPADAPDGQHYESAWEQTETEILQTWHLVDDPVYPEPELTAEEALEIIVGGAT